MNYNKIYYQIIEKRKKCMVEGYGENHHIIPKCMGGTDDKENIIKLTAKEHFLCHLLLVKMFEGTNHYFKLIKAFMMMFKKSKNQERYITSRSYEKLRIVFREAQSKCQSGAGNSQFGKPKSEEVRNKIRKTLLDKTKNYRENKEREKREKIFLKEEKRKKDIDLYKKYYIIYDTKGWDSFVEETGYKYTKANLVQRFSKLVPDFVPQNGKSRGK